jgi:hypothetical protein
MARQAGGPERARLEGLQVRDGRLGLPIQVIAHDVEEPPRVTVSYRKPTAAEARGPGGESVVYPVVAPAGELVCLMCSYLLTEPYAPVDQAACSHVYCKGCWERVPRCPECRFDKPELQLARVVSNIIGGTAVHCPAAVQVDPRSTLHDNRGRLLDFALQSPEQRPATGPPGPLQSKVRKVRCTWTGPLDRLGAHCGGCAHLPVQCGLGGCGAVYAQGSRREHCQSAEHLSAIVAGQARTQAVTLARLEQLERTLGVLQGTARDGLALAMRNGQQEVDRVERSLRRRLSRLEQEDDIALDLDSSSDEDAVRARPRRPAAGGQPAAAVRIHPAAAGAKRPRHERECDLDAVSQGR